MIDFGLIDVVDCNLDINSNWTFCEVVLEIEALRNSYEYFLRFFSYFDLHGEVEFMRRTKNAFYSLHLPEWQIDLLWNYMNRYEYLRTLKMVANRQNVK